jgi:hypothetical protein
VLTRPDATTALRAVPLPRFAGEDKLATTVEALEMTADGKRG